MQNSMNLAQKSASFEPLKKYALQFDTSLEQKTLLYKHNL